MAPTLPPLSPLLLPPALRLPPSHPPCCRLRPIIPLLALRDHGKIPSTCMFVRAAMETKRTDGPLLLAIVRVLQAPAEAVPGRGLGVPGEELPRHLAEAGFGVGVRAGVGWA